MNSMTSVDVMLHLGEPYFELVEPYKRKCLKLEQRMEAYESQERYKEIELERHTHLVSFVLKHRRVATLLLMFDHWKSFVRCLKGMYRRFRHGKLRIWWHSFKMNIFRNRLIRRLEKVKLLTIQCQKEKEDNAAKEAEIELLSAANERSFFPSFLHIVLLSILPSYSPSFLPSFI